MPLTENDYYARGCTALLDAVGKTIQRVINIKRNAAYRTKADKVIFVITTDGMENASIEYSYAMIQSMIEIQRERYGWEFLFLGANIDAVSEASRMGIRADRAVRFNNDMQGIKTNYEALEKTVCMMRSVEDTTQIGDEWKTDIEDDYRRRK